MKSSLCLSTTNKAYLKQTLKIATLALARAYYTYKVCAQESDYQPIGSDLIASNANALIKFPEQIFNFTKNNDIGFCDAPILPYRANVDKVLDATNNGQEMITKLALTCGLGYIAAGTALRRIETFIKNETAKNGSNIMSSIHDAANEINKALVHIDNKDEAHASLQNAQKKILSLEENNFSEMNHEILKKIGFSLGQASEGLNIGAAEQALRLVKALEHEAKYNFINKLS